MTETMTVTVVVATVEFDRLLKHIANIEVQHRRTFQVDFGRTGLGEVVALRLADGPLMLLGELIHGRRIIAQVELRSHENDGHTRGVA